MKDIAVFGAGGFGREVTCLIQLINQSLNEPRWRFVGYFDDNPSLKDTNLEYGGILGGVEELNKWRGPLDVAVAIGNPKSLKAVISSINNPNIDFPNIIAPTTIFLDENNVSLGRGNIICSNSLLSCKVRFGDFNILNGYIAIGHDTSLGSYNVIMPACNISGGISIGDCNFMGLQSAILQYLKIGDNVRISAGAIVMRNTKDGYLYAGVPAQKYDI